MIQLEYSISILCQVLISVLDLIHQAIENSEFMRILSTCMHEIFMQTRFSRMLTKTVYINAIFSMLNLILSVANLFKLKCVKTQFAQKLHAYKYY